MKCPLDDMFDNIEMRQDWLDEGVAAPDKGCIERLQFVAKEVLIGLNLTPEYVEPSIEEGLMACYRLGDLIIHIESYNDDICLVVLVNEEKERLYLAEHHITEVFPALHKLLA